MIIVLIFYSHTGHTLCLAEKIKERLLRDGHSVNVERLQTKKPLRMGDATVDLQFIPDIRPFDAVLLGTPVRGGKPSPPMMAFLDSIHSFDEQNVACFVTGFFRASWGQNQALAYMKELCKRKNAKIVSEGKVRWFSLKRKHQIDTVVNTMSSSFASFEHMF